ncbi:9104_t:CDS:10, partial [Entrophospora sp. SA101]
SPKTIEETYVKLMPLQHVLKRPDTYVGSIVDITEKQWIYNLEEDKLEHKEINYVPAFFKIFDEILVNAADNKMRDPSMNQISVNIDKDDGQISVYNNGKGIPIEIHKELNVYVPEMLFGQLMTSSNYNDDEKKFTGGRNGLGAKSANIFSTKFTVETIDMAKKKQYVQSFYENMTKTDEPKITAYDKKEEYTKISFNPDFEKLGMSKLTNDTIALLNKRVYDIAGTVKNVKVFLNDKQIQTKNFKEYVQMYLKSINVTDGEPSKTDVVHQQFGDHWEVSIAPSIEGQFQQVSFVNSICTSKGGTHVNHVIDQIVTKLIECIEKKNKDLKVKHFQIKNHIWVFVNCLIENPAFDSQTKEIMTLKHHSFRPKCRIDDNFIKKEDAINAGTSLASNCTLILTEGDSAKALVLAGFDVVGNSNWGVYPLRGKLLNVRDASIKQISENKEIQAIKQILGLQHDKEYNSVKDLRYGKLMIMTDQDHDDHQLVEMAFAKKNADERKNWIKSIEDGTYIDYTQHEISIKDFINKELSLFSLADNVRSIPSVIDGLKPGQRKVLFDGIGTGWSTNIPNFNPKDIIQNLRRMINDEELIPMHPWYRGFYGRIQKIDENKYVSYGIIAKKVLIYLMENGFIKNIVRNNCTNERVDLVIELTNKQMEKAESDGLEKFFKLTSSITTSNMMCFNSNNKLVKYESPEEILKEFYSVRLNLYIKRRLHLIEKLQQQVNKMENKIRFINMKLEGGIKFEGLKKLEIVKLLESHKFDKIYSDEIIKGYDYLMGMTCWTFSKEEINKYEEKKKILRDEFAVISGMSAKELWIKDLDALENAWDKFLQCNSLDVDKENRMKFPGITTKARPT